LMKQIAQVERERAELLDPERSPETAKTAKLIEFNGIGPEFVRRDNQGENGATIRMRMPPRG